MTEEEAARLREENAAQARQLAELKAADAQRAQAAVLAENTAFAEAMAAQARSNTRVNDSMSNRRLRAVDADSPVRSVSAAAGGIAASEQAMRT